MPLQNGDTVRRWLVEVEGRDTMGERAPTVKPRWSVAAERQSEVGEVVVRDPPQAQRDTPGQLVAA